MYVHNEYWQSDKAMHLYPSNTNTFEEMDFREFNVFGGKAEHHACGLSKISIFKEGTNVLDDRIEVTIIDRFIQNNNNQGKAIIQI